MEQDSGGLADPLNILGFFVIQFMSCSRRQELMLVRVLVSVPGIPAVTVGVELGRAFVAGRRAAGALHPDFDIVDGGELPMEKLIQCHAPA